MEADERREAQEGFGEAGIGEAQSENPPSDPEMIRDDGDEESGDGGVEEVGGDPDAEPASEPGEYQPDQAEG